MMRILFLICIFATLFSCGNNNLNFIKNSSWVSNDLVFTSNLNGTNDETEKTSTPISMQLDAFNKVTAGDFTGSYTLVNGIEPQFFVVGTRESELIPTRTVVDYEFEFIVTENLLTIVSGKRTTSWFDTIDSNVYNIQIDTFKAGGIFEKKGNARQFLKDTKWLTLEAVTFLNNGNETIFSGTENAKGIVEVWFNKNQSTTILIYAESKNWRKREIYPESVIENYTEGEIAYRYNIEKVLGAAPYDSNLSSAEISVATGSFFTAVLDKLTDPQSFSVETGETINFSNNITTGALVAPVIFGRKN